MRIYCRVELVPMAVLPRLEQEVDRGGDSMLPFRPTDSTADKRPSPENGH